MVGRRTEARCPQIQVICIYWALEVPDSYVANNPIHMITGLRWGVQHGEITPSPTQRAYWGRQI